MQRSCADVNTPLNEMAEITRGARWVIQCHQSFIGFSGANSDPDPAFTLIAEPDPGFATGVVDGSDAVTGYGIQLQIVLLVCLVRSLQKSLRSACSTFEVSVNKNMKILVLTFLRST
jgi:hypothetical protein